MSRPASSAPARFTFRRPDGTLLVGPVMGAGGLLTRPEALAADKVRAANGRPLRSAVEPSPGDVAVYPDYAAAGDGVAVHMPIASLVTQEAILPGDADACLAVVLADDLRAAGAT